MATPEQITPDTKDWTWVLERPCPECGFDGTTVPREGYGAAIRENAADWPPVLAGPAASERPRPEVWSATEYACHVRDVHLLFAERLEQMLTDDDAKFANWDQDAAAVEQCYDLQEPGRVATELVAAAERVAVVYDGVSAEAWGRRGLRSNGDAFTVESFGRYHLHDVVHHSWDVGA